MGAGRTIILTAGRCWHYGFRLLRRGHLLRYSIAGTLFHSNFFFHRHFLKALLVCDRRRTLNFSFCAAIFFFLGIFEFAPSSRLSSTGERMKGGDNLIPTALMLSASRRQGGCGFDLGSLTRGHYPLFVCFFFFFFCSDRQSWETSISSRRIYLLFDPSIRPLWSCTLSQCFAF